MATTEDLNLRIQIESWRKEKPRRLTALYDLLVRNQGFLNSKGDETPKIDADLAKVKQLGQDFDAYHISQNKKHYYEYRERFSSDPLSDITRKERRNLLSVSAISLFIIFSNASTNNFEFFGIKFDGAPLIAFDTGLLVACLYFMLAFVFYGKDDLYKLSIAEAYLHQLKKSLYTPLNEKVVGYLNNFQHTWIRDLVKEAIHDFDFNEGFGYSLALSSPWMEDQPQSGFFKKHLSPFIALPIRHNFDLLLPIFAGVYAIILLLKKILIELYVSIIF